jgi:hypothetical protein
MRQGGFFALYGHGEMAVSPSRGWSNVRKFYDEGLWTDPLPARPVLARPFVRVIRLLIVAASAFQDRMLNLHAMGLV